MNTFARPSLRSANWLYLISMVLILTIGSFLQLRSLSWGLLATEVGLILVPTLLFIRGSRLSARAVLQWRWPGWRLVGLGALAGAGTWGLGIGLQGLASFLLGYTPPSALAMVAPDPLNLAVFVLAMTLAAPLCEEPLFRGYLLSAYGRFSPRAAWLAVALLFALFHLQFSGLFGLLPIALVLGVLAQRSRSLAPAIAAHMANNALGAALTVLGRTNPDLAIGQFLTAALCGYMVVGPILALAALTAFWRATRPAAPEAAPAPEAPAPTPAPSRGAFWPLAGAAALYVLIAGAELVTGRFPQLMAERELRLEPAPWPQPVSLAYDLSNMANESVGETTCTLTPQGGTVAFDCATTQRHFQIQVGQSTYAGGTYALKQAGHWDTATMRLLDAALVFEGEYGGWSAAVVPNPSDGLSLNLDGAGSSSLPADAVLAAEWPLRMMALPFDQPLYFGSRFNQVALAPGLADGALTESVVLVAAREELQLPAGGQVRAVKMTLGQQTAWYAAEAPHTLLRYSDGYGVTWTLRSPAPDPAGN